MCVCVCVPTDTPWLTQQLCSRRSSTSHNWVFIWSTTNVYIRKPSWNPNSNMENDCSATCIILLSPLPHWTFITTCKNSASTYLLTLWSRVLLEKLTGLQLVKKFPVFCGTQRFITALTTARHMSLPWASSIQSTPPNPTPLRSILILSYHLRLGLPSGFFPSGFTTKTQHMPLLSLIRATCPPSSFFSILSPEQYVVSSTDH